MSSVTKKSEKPSYWRSLAELEGSPEFEQFIEHEFAEPVSDLPPTSDERRRFMQRAETRFSSTTTSRCEQPQAALRLDR